VVHNTKETRLYISEKFVNVCDLQVSTSKYVTHMIL